MPAARAEELSLLLIQSAVQPEELVAPGDVMLSFTVENVSAAYLRNIYLSSADGLLYELVGELAPGEAQFFSRQHSVTDAELDAGEIVYIISYDDPDDTDRKVNTTVRTPIRRSDARPSVEFTRQFSNRIVEPGGTVTVTYRIRNTGNVVLADLQVQDALGNYTGRVENLGIGESRTLISRATIHEATVSSASLSYHPQGSEEILVETLADVAVNLANAKLNGLFTAGYSAFSSSVADVVLTLANDGNVGYHDLCVIDDLYGGVIADGLVLAAGDEALEISRAYSVRGSSGFRWRVTGVSDSGARVNYLTDTLILSPREADSAAALTLSVRALTPNIRREGDVIMRVLIENPGDVDARDIVLTEDSLGALHTFAALPADGMIQQDFTVHVSEDSSFHFSLQATTRNGDAISAGAAPVEVSISPDGVLLPGTQEHFFEFNGGSIKIGGSSTFAVLLLAGVAALLVLIVILIIANRRARLERQLKLAAERRRRKEEPGKTGRISPVRAPQKTKSKGRN